HHRPIVSDGHGPMGLTSGRPISERFLLVGAGFSRRGRTIVRLFFSASPTRRFVLPSPPPSGRGGSRSRSLLRLEEHGSEKCGHNRGCTSVTADAILPGGGRSPGLPLST